MIANRFAGLAALLALKRVRMDPLLCPCGGKLNRIAWITNPAVKG